MNNEVIVVGFCSDTLEMLQRRMGGILKGIAHVEKMLPQEITDDDGPLFVCLAYGENYDSLTRRFRQQDKVIIGTELTLLPSVIRALRQIDGKKVLGVVANHQICANYFCSEIIRSAPSYNRYITGTFGDMDKMPVDVFLVPEELDATVKKFKVNREVLFLPRSVSPRSAAEIIDQAIRIFSS